MANPEHVKMLVTCTVDQWDAWRRANPYIAIDVSGAPVGNLRLDNGLITKEGLADFRRFDLTGVDLTESNFRRSDLSGANLSNGRYKKVILPLTKMYRINLSRSEMRNCVMTFADLTDANLTRTEFPNSYLMNSCFQDAILHMADFRDADLTGADFSGCDLRTTSLTGSNLACARLFRASNIIDETNRNRLLSIVRDDFDGSYDDYASWQDHINQLMLNRDAGLNDLRQYTRYIGWHNVQPPGVLKTVGSVQELLKFLENVLSLYEGMFGSDAFRCYYRGEETTESLLTPSLYREIADDIEPELISELMTRVPDRFRETDSPFDRLVVAQQHGLPTRLLDVTRNPLVALYFALRKAKPGRDAAPDAPARIHLFVSPVGMIRRHDDELVNLAASFSGLTWMEQDVILTRCFEWGDDDQPDRSVVHEDHGMPNYVAVLRRIVELIAPNTPHLIDRIDPKDLFRVFVVEPKRSFQRIRSQAGAFLLSGFHKRFESDEVRKVDNSINIYDHSTIEVDVSGERHASMLKQLDYLNINEETMFPGLESAAKAIATQHARPA